MSELREMARSRYRENARHRLQYQVGRRLAVVFLGGLVFTLAALLTIANIAWHAARPVTVPIERSLTDGR